MSMPATPDAFATAVEAVLAEPKSKPKRRDTGSGRFYTLDDGMTVPSVTHIDSCIAKPALVAWAAKMERLACIDAAADFYLDLLHAAPMSRSAYVTTLNARLKATKAHQSEMEKAQNIGAEAHAYIEWAMRRALGRTVEPEPVVSEQALWAYMAASDWMQSVKLVPIWIEQVVYSRTHQYAGTMDLLAKVDGRALLGTVREIPPWLPDLITRVPEPLVLLDWKSGKAVYAESFLQNAAYRAAMVEMGHPAPDLGLIVRLPKETDDPRFEVVVAPPVEDIFPVFCAVNAVFRWWWTEEQAAQKRRRKT